MPAPTQEQMMMPFLERLYGPLLKKLNLAPEQSGKIYQLILDNKMKGQAQMGELLRHEDTSRMARNMADLRKELDTSLEALLGTENFTKYQEYQAGVPDRGILERTKHDFVECPLTEEEQEKLLTAMATARKAVGGSDAGFSIADTTEEMNQKLNRQDSIDKHILQLAADFLSPAQINILRSTQATTKAARKEGYAKTQAMFGDQNHDSKPSTSGTAI